MRRGRLKRVVKVPELGPVQIYYKTLGQSSGRWSRADAAAHQDVSSLNFMKHKIYRSISSTRICNCTASLVVLGKVCQISAFRHCLSPILVVRRLPARRGDECANNDDIKNGNLSYFCDTV